VFLPTFASGSFPLLLPSLCVWTALPLPPFQGPSRSPSFSSKSVAKIGCHLFSPHLPSTPFPFSLRVAFLQTSISESVFPAVWPRASFPPGHETFPPFWIPGQTLFTYFLVPCMVLRTLSSPSAPFLFFRLRFFPPKTRPVLPHKNRESCRDLLPFSSFFSSLGLGPHFFKEGKCSFFFASRARLIRKFYLSSLFFLPLPDRNGKKSSRKKGRSVVFSSLPFFFFL